MVSKVCVLLPRETGKLSEEERKIAEKCDPARKCWEYDQAPPGYNLPASKGITDDCKISGIKEGTEECKPTGLCWERASPFTGGSVPWKGTAREQEAAAREATSEGRDPPCRWARCPWHSCPLYDCSGNYDLQKFRPVCREFTKPLDKTKKQVWCYPFEGHILHHCDPCKPGRYDCPVKETKKICPSKPPKIIPLFRWQHGIPYPNIRKEPYPHLLEGLDWKKQPPPGPPPRRESDLWSLGCWSFVDGEEDPTFEPCSLPAPCPGQFKGDTPPFNWHNGYPKENFSLLPYPGHGPKIFDPCQARLDAERLRICGPDPPRVTAEEAEARCRLLGVANAGTWCAALSSPNVPSA